jgi:hypothetical protein
MKVENALIVMLMHDAAVSYASAKVAAEFIA